MSNEQINSKIKLWNNSSFAILIFGWGSKFRMTKCRTADISKIRNFEYWNNESRVIRFFYFRIYSLFLWLFKLFEHSKYIFDNLPSNSKVFKFW